MESVERKFMITEPITLPWLFVTPTKNQGLEYHLTKDLSIVMHGITDGEIDFKIGNVLIAHYGEEASEVQAEEMFKNDILPNKTQERIERSLKDEEISCFFSTKEMEYLQKLFEQKNFVSKDVQVLFNGAPVDDIPSLAPKEFKLVLEKFSELNVVGVFDYKKSRDEWEDEYEKYFQEKVAEREREAKGSVWKKVKKKDTRRKSLGTMASLIGGALLMSAKQMLNKREGFKWKLLGSCASGAGILLEMYGKKTFGELFRSLNENSKGKAVFD